MIQIKEWINKNILLLVFLVEILNNININYGFQNLRISLLIKALLFLFFLVGIEHKERYILASLFFIFIFSFLIIDYQFMTKDIFENNISFSKYLFFPLTFFHFKNLLSDKGFYTSLKKQFEVLFLFNYALILIGYLFEVDLLKTYRGDRFGFNGIFVSQNEASYILLSGFFYFFWILRNNPKNTNLFKVGLSVVALCLSGTKTVYFSLILFMIGYFTYNRNIIVGGLSIFTVIIITYVAISNSIVSSFYNLYAEKGFWYSLTSYRSEYIQTRFIHQIKNQWEFLNYLFGGSFYSSYVLIEMGILDLFIFFGCIGLCIYSFTIYRACGSFVKNRYTFLTASILLVGSFFSGHFFLSGSAAIYLASSMYLINVNAFKDN